MNSARIGQARAPGRPGGEAPLLRISPGRTRLRRGADTAAKRLVMFGGIAVIGSIIAILIVIVAEFAPLFIPPSADPMVKFGRLIDGDVLAAGLEEYREVGFLVSGGAVHFIALPDGKPVRTVPLDLPAGVAVIRASAPRGGHLALVLSDGRILPVEISFSTSFSGGRRTIDADATRGEPIGLDVGDAPACVDAVRTDGGEIIATVDGRKALAVVQIEETRNLMGEVSRSESRSGLSLETEGDIVAIAVDGRGDKVFLGTSKGHLLAVDLRAAGGPRIAAEARATSGPAVTALGLLIGDRTLVVGDAAGGVGTWQVLAGDDRKPALVPIHRYDSHPGPVVSIASCRRNKGFITGDGTGKVLLHHGTTGKTTLALDGMAGLRSIAFAPRGDGILSVGSGEGASWSLHNRYPEISFGTLFGKTWYEGYREPAYVWQSSGATDDVEAKLSLIPLIFGTLKGTFYALLIAVPVSVLAALYASQFMNPAWKSFLKPMVEIMAALPSVVLGFVAGLWLAPYLEKVVPGVFLLPFTIIPFAVLAAFSWRKTPVRWKALLRPGSEVFLLVPVVLAAAWAAFALGGLIEAGLLGGDFRTWLRGAIGLTFDQRNSLVVGFAMGFAVIPIIFTIAEDSLANVPQSLVAGSLALGATRWQTALRVVLPTASPGIFSAVMIGFGRAVGETMIVLMATGNTPILDINIFNGFRTLSANIAVELPEAPEGETLFRVLFLSAFLLFAMTFAVNTVAEIVRLRLRKRYRYA
jgi:phosphate transport system permease protein